MLDYLSKMQKRKLLGSFVSTALLGFVAILVVVMYMNSSLGWFAQNREVAGTGMNLRVEGMTAEADYTVYIFDAKANTVRYTGDGRDASDPKIDDLDMQIHDVIFKSRNRYTPAVVHIHLYNIKQDYRTNGTVTLTLTRNSDPAYETGQGGRLQLPEKTTSILRFTLINNNGASWLSSNAVPHAAAVETYNSIDTALYEKIVTNKDYTDTVSVDLDSKVFTTVTKSGSVITGISKLSEINLSVDYSAAEISGGELDLLLYITYDEGLVANFEQSVGIDTDSTTVGKITTLLNDLTGLVISFSE